MTKRLAETDERTTSRHLERLVRHVQAGAHVVLRGHLRDDVLLADRIADEPWAIASALAGDVGIPWLFVANQADGTFCADPEREAAAGDFFARLSPVGDHDREPALQHTDPVGLAETLRVLLRQEDRPVAILLEDAGAIFGGLDAEARLGLGVLLEGIAEASYFERRGGVAPHNTLIVYGAPDGHAVEAIAALPGVEELTVEPPNRGERIAALRDLRQSFYRGGNGGRPSEKDLEVLTKMTDGWSLRAVRGLGRSSHAVKVPATRPETLYRRARGEKSLTPLGEAGVENIMEQLRAEVRGQTETLDSVQQKLELGCWRPANRARGTLGTRPMATLTMHGPPGVGKTETALILAEALLGSRGALRRIDCSEMRNEHDIARLTGAPPGYVGYSEGGALTETLEQDAAVILFDEFDRAHPGMKEALLGILDAGRLTDGRGRTATFENAILLFTTNLGFREDEASGLDYSDLPTRKWFVGNNQKNLEDAIKNGPKNEKGKPEHRGSPALWSRLKSSLVGFDVLRPTGVEDIVTVSCKRLELNLADEYDIQLSLAAEQFAPAVGARTMEAGTWDGRSVYPEVQQLIEMPVRGELTELERRHQLPPGMELRFVPDRDGRAVRS